jgi:hypothetical protein
LLVVLLLSTILISYPVTHISNAANQYYGVTVTRILPSYVYPGQVFNVVVAFTSPTDNLNSIGLSDFAPASWAVAVDDAWNSPNSDTNKVTANRADYVWYGPFDNGTEFSAVYQVTVPANTTPGTYFFTGSSSTPYLEYYATGEGPYIVNIEGQTQVTIAAPIFKSILPSSGPIAGGTPVTISGMGFISGNTTVTIGGNAATSVIVENATSIKAITPAGTTGAKDIVVTTPNGSSTLTDGFTYITTSSGGGGGGGGSISPVLTLSGFSTSTPLNINSSGVLQAAVKLQTTDGLLSLEISKGTRLLTSSNSALSSISVTPLASLPQVPASNALVLAYAFSPDGAKFDPTLTLALTYDPAKLPIGVAEDDLYIAYFDGTQWQKLETRVDSSTKTATSKVSHFSAFALIGRASLPPVTVTPTPIPTSVVIPTSTSTKTPAPSIISQTTPPPASVSITTAPPVTSPPSATPLTTMPLTTPVPVKPSVTPWGIIVGIIAGLIIVFSIGVIFISKKRSKK